MTGSIVLLAIGVIIIGCGIYQHSKSTFVKAFATAIAAICAWVVALGFFGVLAKALVSVSGDSDFLVRWGPLLCFVVLFVLAFAILQTIINLLTRRAIDLGLWPERIGRVASGVILGFTLSRVLFVVLMMTLGPRRLQTGNLGRYLRPRAISVPKQAPQTKPAKPSRQRKSSPPKESRTTPQRGRLSDVSRSVIGTDFDE